MWCARGAISGRGASSGPSRSSTTGTRSRSSTAPSSSTPRRLGVDVPTLDLLASKYGMSTQQADAAQREMEQRAAAEGLDFHLESLESGNTRAAHRLIHLAARRASRPRWSSGCTAPTSSSIPRSSTRPY